MSYLDQLQNFSNEINGGSVYVPDFSTPASKSRDAFVNFRPDKAAEAAGLAGGKDGQDFRNALATQYAGSLQSFYDDEARDYRTAQIENDRFLLQATTNLRSQRELNADAFNYGVQSTLIGQPLDFARDQLQGAIQLAGVQEQGRQNRLQANTEAVNDRNLARTEGFEARLNIAQTGLENRLQSNTDALNAQNTSRVQGFENRLADAQAQTAQLRFIGAQGNEERLGIAEQGFQDRLGITQQGLEARLLENTSAINRQNQARVEGFENRLADAQAQTAQLRFIGAQGNEQRLLATETGFQDRLLAAQQGVEQRRNTAMQGREERLLAEEQGFQTRFNTAQGGFEQRRGIAAEGFEQRLGLNEQARLSDQSKDLDSNRSRSLAMRWGGDVQKTEANYRPAQVSDYGPISEVQRTTSGVAGMSDAGERSQVEGRTNTAGLQNYGNVDARRSTARDADIVSNAQFNRQTQATGRTATVGNQSYGSVEARRSSLSDTELADNGRFESASGALRSSVSDVELESNSRYEGRSAEERADVDSWNEASTRNVDEALRRAGAFKAKQGQGASNA
ncbi:hypothetical protein [Synechococcus elongatus]|uniref:hypothetical protein n=1 Tax=Synechococcus elongatus TaxID=32046 RepID=UPI000F7DED9E|nr:hypothetical protein [Synechococcus elongatus]